MSVRFFCLICISVLCSLFAGCGPEPGGEEVIERKRVGGDTVVTDVRQLDYLDLNLPSRYYLVFRQELSLLDVNGFFGMESEALTVAAAKAGIEATGPFSVLTYEWDTERGWADVAVALPVRADTRLPPYVTIELPATKALALDLEGDYEQLSVMHVTLDRELARRGLRPRLPAVEEYAVGPLQTNDPDEFRTRLIYPYESPAQ